MRSRHLPTGAVAAAGITTAETDMGLGVASPKNHGVIENMRRRNVLENMTIPQQITIAVLLIATLISFPPMIFID